MTFILNFGQNSKDWIDIFGALGPSIIGTVAILIAVIANKISSNNLKQQKKQFEKQLLEQHQQWKYDAIVRSEMDVLITLRSMLYYTNDAIHWFMWKFLSPFGEYPNLFHNTELEVFRRIIFVKFWNELNNVNNEFNKNLLIWKKYKLASRIQFIQAILTLITFLPQNGDFEIEYEENTNNYKIKNFNEIKLKFAEESNELFVKSKIIDNYASIEKSKLLNNYSFIWGNVLDILNNLEANIYNIMADYEKLNIPETENIGKRTFMPYTEVK